jgi:purine-binding chemotaxis protein CheW
MDEAISAAPGGLSGQFVTFQIDEGLFAVPLAEVQEIIRMPAVVQVPLSPPSLEGLANLRGSVMAITSLRRIFGYPDAPHDDATRVVVLNQGVPAGLVVDRMARVVTALESEIEPAGAIEATVRSELLRGMIRQSDDRGMIMILDARTLGTGGGEAPRGRVAAREAALAAEETPVEAGVRVSEDIQLVSFEVAGQEYALAIEHVQEIVQLPPRIAGVPRAQSHVLGVMTLREKLLPLVSLRAMFGMPEALADERSKIVVVPLPDGSSVGIVMDMVREVLRVSRKCMDPMPSMLGGGEGGDITGICRLQEGKRLVSVLAADSLFGSAAVRDAVREVAATEGGEMQTTQADASADTEEQFVVFRLGDEEYGAPIEAVQEIVRVPESLTRVPKAPAFIRGVVNLRGAVLPVVDQRSRFELPEIPRNDRQRIMVFTIGGVRTGFIIDSVSEVLKIPRRAIGPAPALSAEQARLISRVANLEAQQRMILLIAADELLAGDEFSAVADAAGIVKH